MELPNHQNHTFNQSDEAQLAVSYSTSCKIEVGAKVQKFVSIRNWLQKPKVEIHAYSLIQKRSTQNGFTMYVG